MIIIKASKDSEAGIMPAEDLFAAMADYHEELAKAGVLLDANGLHPSSKGWRIKYESGKRRVIDGPFAETKELIAGYWIINVKSREEAIAWASKAPFQHLPNQGHPAELEIRQFFEEEDFKDVV
jgi:hypothetical protein